MIYLWHFSCYDVIYGLGYEWVRSRFVYSFVHTNMHFHVINSMPEFRPFRRKSWLRCREILISAMASQTFPEFMLLIISWGNNLRTVIRKCSHSNRTLFVACNGSGSGCLTSPLGTTVRSDSGTLDRKSTRLNSSHRP